MKDHLSQKETEKTELGSEEKSLRSPRPPVERKQLRIVAMAAFAMCDDGTTRKVILPKGHARKLHNYVKHNLSGGMITLAAEPCAIVPPAVPKKSLIDKVRDMGRALRRPRLARRPVIVTPSAIRNSPSS